MMLVWLVGLLLMLLLVMALTDCEDAEVRTDTGQCHRHVHVNTEVF